MEHSRKLNRHYQNLHNVTGAETGIQLSMFVASSGGCRGVLHFALTGSLQVLKGGMTCAVTCR